MSRRLQAAPLHPIAVALRNGTRDLREYLHAICDRIDALDPDIQAFVSEPNRRERLLQEENVAITPGIDFAVQGGEHHVRIAFTNEVPRLQEAMERLARFLGRL